MANQEFFWWYSIDAGDRYYGPYKSRDEAITAGLAECDDESFIICEANKGDLATEIFDDLEERLNEANYENIDPDGDPIGCLITTDQWKDLRDRLNAVAAAWANDHNLHQHVWSFGEVRNEETIRKIREGRKEAHAARGGEG